MLGGSILALVILFTVGLPALLNLSAAISTLRRGNPVSVTEKGVAPTTPYFSQDLVATSSAKTKISGATDPKTTVEIFQNARSLGTTVSSDDGTFSQEVDLERGINTFTAQAVNETGQKSPLSDSLQISFFSDKPKLEIASPKDGDSTNNSSINISGQTDPGNSVNINDRLAIVDKDGKFSYSLDLTKGENKIKITAVDPAGGSTSKELKITTP